MGALNPKRAALPDFRNKLQFCIHQMAINPFHISRLHSNRIWWIAHCFGTVRIREHVTGSMEAHDQEVCGLKWSPSGQQLASGGNDNLLHIWDAAAASSQGPSPYLHRLDRWPSSCCEGIGMVSFPKQPARLRWWNRRPLHQVLEHTHWCLCE